MPLALFDLDNTLLSGDSDYLWGVFLVEKGIVDGEFYERENTRFYEEYKAGCLDIYEFLHFSLKPLRENSLDLMYKLREEFLQKKIDPIIPIASRSLINKHINAGDELLIITATNAFVTKPIAQRFGVHHLIATEPEMIEGRYTGRVAGEPCFQEGKVSRLKDWLQEQQLDLKESWFYSDSHNDLPLLEEVEHPVAVNPDETLEELAKTRGWPIISLHD